MGPKKMDNGNCSWKYWGRVLLPGSGILLLLVYACVQGGKAMIAEPKVVPYVELERYLGTWYEIARHPQRFQEGCVASKAVYELGRDGKSRSTMSAARVRWKGRSSRCGERPRSSTRLPTPN